MPTLETSADHVARGSAAPPCGAQPGAAANAAVRHSGACAATVREQAHVGVSARTCLARLLPESGVRRPGELTTLSIGRLAADQAKYYLDQAGCALTFVQNVGGGVERYYLGPSEARGLWIGAAVHELGLRDEVSADALRRVLDGLRSA